MYCSDLARCAETLQIATSAASELHDSAAASPLPAPQYLPLLRERGAGVFEGTPLGTVDAAAAAAGMTTVAFRPDGGESWGDVRARAVKFLTLYVYSAFACLFCACLGRNLTFWSGCNRLAAHIPRAREESETVLAVTHGGFIRGAYIVLAACEHAPSEALLLPALRSVAAERSPPGAPAVPNAGQRAGNTAIYTFELQRTPSGGWNCALIAANDTAHLAELEAAAEHETE